MAKVVEGDQGLVSIMRDELRERLHSRLGQSLDSYESVVAKLIDQGIWIVSTTDDNLLELDLDIARDRLQELQKAYEFPWLARRISTLARTFSDPSDGAEPSVDIKNIVAGLTGS